MNKDQAEGKLKDVGGRVERQVGEWTGDEEKQGHGAMKQAEGKVQKAWGDVKEAGKKAVDRADEKTAERETPTETEVEEKEVHTTRRKAS
ncbi:MAG: CsbD family protein [Candidatus Sulfotelmatobacter sp.]